MRASTIFAVFALIVFFGSQTHAQSGSRGYSGGGSIGGGGGYSTGGGSGSRLSRAERQRLQQQQLEQRRQLAEAMRIQKAETAKVQFKQSLVNLGMQKHNRLNSKQNKVALEEAKSDYQALRRGSVAPNGLGSLQSPFRLTKREIDRDKRVANWPELLQGSEFQAQVADIDAAILNGITDAKAAEQFLSDLNKLNTGLNTIAIREKLSITTYAKARRFISGLANEVRASNLVM